MRSVEIVMATALFLTFAFFHHSEPGWNVNSRLALTCAIVEHGTVRIDDYWNKPGIDTQDVAAYKGHRYSDKIIGTSLLGVPAFGVLRLVEASRGAKFSWGVRRYVVTTFSIGLLAALSGILMLRLLRILAPKTSEAGLFAVVFLMFLGTQLLFYSTLFMSYIPTVFFLLWALLLLERKGSPAPFRLGVLLGLAVLCEYTAAIAAGLLAIYALHKWRNGRSVAMITAGGLLALMPFFVYTLAVFGRLAIPYQYEQFGLFRTYMSRGIMGITLPKPYVAWLVTFHPFRGVFFHSPFLLIALAGAVVLLRRDCALALMILSIFAAYVLFNSGYYMWWGGWSFGARHLIPALPFLAIPLARVWNSKPLRWLIVAAGIWAVCIHLVVNAVDPQFPDRNYDPRAHDRMPPLRWLLEPDIAYNYSWVFPAHVWPMFKTGAIDRNAATKAGMKGPVSLAPLFLLWGSVFWYVNRRLRAPLR